MTRFSQPNPDAWTAVGAALTRRFERGEVRLELWENDGRSLWVLVVDDGSGPSHAVLPDGAAAMVLRVLGPEDDEPEPEGRRLLIHRLECDTCDRVAHADRNVGCWSENCDGEMRVAENEVDDIRAEQ